MLGLLSGELFGTPCEAFLNYFLGLWYGWWFYIRKTGAVFNLLQVIATRTFSVLFLRLDTKHYEKWIVLIAQWSLIGTIVIGGPATAKSDRHGPFCESCLICEFLQSSWPLSDGIAGDWCWIAANYTVHRIMYVFKTTRLFPWIHRAHSLDSVVVGFW